MMQNSPIMKSKIMAKKKLDPLRQTTTEETSRVEFKYTAYKSASRLNNSIESQSVS